MTAASHGHAHAATMSRLLARLSTKEQSGRSLQDQGADASASLVAQAGRAGTRLSANQRTNANASAASPTPLDVTRPSIPASSDGGVHGQNAGTNTSRAMAAVLLGGHQRKGNVGSSRHEAMSRLLKREGSAKWPGTARSSVSGSTTARATSPDIEAPEGIDHLIPKAVPPLVHQVTRRSLAIPAVTTWRGEDIQLEAEPSPPTSPATSVGRLSPEGGTSPLSPASGSPGGSRRRLLQAWQVTSQMKITSWVCSMVCPWHGSNHSQLQNLRRTLASLNLATSASSPKRAPFRRGVLLLVRSPSTLRSSYSTGRG